MGNLHLVTGYAGEPHVTSADQGSLFEALIRGGQFVMEAGANFAASIVTNNLIRVSDGELMMQGRHVKLTPGAYVDLTIDNGAQGFLRNDLIVARYTRNAVNGVEECSLVVLKGTPVEINPSDPEYTVGNLNSESTLQHDFPLYRVPISGLNVGTLEALFVSQKSLYNSILPTTGGTMTGNIAMSGKKITGLGDPTANGDAVSLKYAAQNFAPIGYGLGTAARFLTNADNLDTLWRGGNYYWTNVAPANAPALNTVTNGCFAYMRIDAANEDNLTQTVYSFYPGDRGLIMARSKSDGTMGVWEWVNPPMMAGTEYRTTERYQGAAVYKKVNSSGDVLWRKDGESKWHLLTSADYIADATIE